MKHLRLTFYLGMALLMILMACAPSTSTQTAPPPAGNEAGSSSAQASSESSPSASPVNLAPPEMKVGSTFLYADGSLLVAVPAGPFTMGQGGIDNPIHQVTLSDFWIYRTKVTNAQFAYCVSQGGCTPPNPRNNKGYADPLKSQDPVTGVKYDQAAAYCAFVHGRLPTEAEWEKAARGPDGNIYPWGDGSPTCDLLNFNDCTGGTTRVNQYPQGKSYYTAFDMEGNTFEWTADWYKADYYSISPANDPTGPEKGSQRSVRSSAFNSGGNQTPAAMRFFSRPEDDRANLGFRCVVLDPTYFAPFCNYPATYDTDGVGGGPSGPQTKVDCPSLGIQQTPGCNENNPSTIVTFNGPSGSTITAPPPPGCQPTNNPNQYTCTKDGTLQICSSCTVTTTSQPQCPDGYAYDAASKSCIPNHGSSSGQCLPGFVLGEGDHPPVLTTNTPVPGAVNQCCSTGAGSSGVTLSEAPTPTCPAGTFFDGTQCIGTQIIYPYCKTTGVNLNSCTPENNTCNLDPASCVGSCVYFDPATCSCKYNPNC